VADDSKDKFPEATFSGFFAIKAANLVFSLTEKLDEAELTRTESCTVKIQLSACGATRMGAETSALINLINRQ